MKRIPALLILLVFTAACSSAPNTSAIAISPTPAESVPQATIPEPTQPPTSVPVPTATIVPTPTPVPVDIGTSYTGYWLKLVKVEDPTGSQTMTLYYQDGATLTVIATFCVHAGDNNTPDGFYFIAIGRPTTFPHAPVGYKTVFYSHNYAWKYGFRNGKSANWYLHSADWNKSGVNGCPTRASGGCVNMRTADFNILLSGGPYVNPITGETSTIPHLGVGTPFIIADSENACTYLGQCMPAYKCVSGKDCFHKFTCDVCIDWGTKWDILAGENPSIKALDVPSS